MYKRISIGYFEFPNNIIITPAKDLISNLLQKDISKRLGCHSNRAENIKSHAWFKSVDWNMVFQKKIQPPWLPELSDPNDAHYYEKYSDSSNAYVEIS
jgi:serine/threonine protein kinase